MATEIVGKKIDQLNESNVITDDTVLPAVVVQGGVPQNTATKVSVKTLKSNIQNGVLLEPNIVQDLTTTSIELNNAVRNTIYQYGVLDDLTITNYDTSYFKTIIYFTSGSVPTNLTFTNEPTWIDGKPNIEADAEYVITICNGLAKIDSSKESGKSSDNIIELPASSTINLISGNIYKGIISENTTFILPTITDNNQFNQILIQLQIQGTPTINWGTNRYFNAEPIVAEGFSNIIYEYDSLLNAWVVGQIEKIQL